MSRNGQLPLWGLCAALLMLLALSTAGFAQAVDPPSSITEPPPPSDDDFKTKIQSPHREALKSNQPDRVAKQLIADSVHYQVYLLVTLPGERGRNMKKLTDDLRNRSTSEAARLYALEQCVFRASQLLDHADGGVKVAGAVLLNQLNVSWNPDVPFVGSKDALLKALAVDDKHLDVKVWAADGLARILRLATGRDLPVLERVAIANALAQEVTRLRSVRDAANGPDPVGYQWCMWSMVQALGHCDRVYNSTRDPIFADTLLAVLTDPKEDFYSRALAAESLGRLPYEATTNLDLLNYETVWLTYDLATAYNAELKDANLQPEQRWPLWRRCAFHLYFAYEGRSKADQTRNFGLSYQAARPGLSAFGAAIKLAFDAQLPIINGFTGNPQKPPLVSQEKLNALSVWLADHTPKSRKLTPESKFEAPTHKGTATPEAADGGPPAE
ncbi:MAG: hypothetical protein R3B90_02815 [Planctomycetaceae bacterium]